MSSEQRFIECPNCGANVSVDDNSEMVICLYCGTQLKNTNRHVPVEHVVRTIDEAAIMREQRKREKQKEEDKSDNKVLIGIAIIFAIMMLSYPVYSLLVSLNVVKPDSVYAPVDNDRAFRGLYYEDVEKSLRDARFENIQLLPLNDLKDERDKKMNTVSSVTISGKDDFTEWHLIGGTEKKSFEWNDLVVISYHSPKDK